MNGNLNALAFGAAAAIVAAALMLLLGILGNLGIYTGAVLMMGQWHLFFSLTPAGILAGMAEAAISTFVFVYIFGLIYNRIIVD
jgi:hypothetical protein